MLCILAAKIFFSLFALTLSNFFYFFKIYHNFIIHFSAKLDKTFVLIYYFNIERMLMSYFDGINLLKNLTEKQKDNFSVLVKIAKNYDLGIEVISSFCSPRLCKIFAIALKVAPCFDLNINGDNNYKRLIFLECIQNVDEKIKKEKTQLKTEEQILESYVFNQDSWLQKLIVQGDIFCDAKTSKELLELADKINQKISKAKKLAKCFENKFETQEAIYNEKRFEGNSSYF